MNRWKKSIAKHGRFFSRRYRNADANQAEGIHLIKLGQSKQAIEKLATAIKLDPKNDWSYAVQGFSYNQLGEYALAAESFRQAIILNPNKGVYYSQLGEVFHQWGKIDLAVGAYGKAIIVGLSSTENYVNALLNLGSVSRQIGKESLAITCYDQVIELDPTNVHAYNRKGDCHWTLADYALAADSYSKAVEFDPANVHGYLHFGAAAFALGGTETAVLCWDKVTTLEPQSGAGNLLLALAYQYMGDYPKALENFDQSLSLSPNVALSYSLKGQAYHAQGDYEKAVECYDNATAYNPEYMNAYLNKAYSLIEMSLHEEAGKNLSHVIDSDVEVDNHVRATTLFLRGFYIHGTSGQYSEGIADIEKGLSLDPDRMLAKQWLEQLRQESAQATTIATIRASVGEIKAELLAEVRGELQQALEPLMEIIRDRDVQQRAHETMINRVDLTEAEPVEPLPPEVQETLDRRKETANILRAFAAHGKNVKKVMETANVSRGTVNNSLNDFCKAISTFEPKALDENGRPNEYIAVRYAEKHGII